MSSNAINLKNKSYVSEGFNMESMDSSINNPTGDQTKNQLDDSKMNKRLALLKVNWYKVKSQKIPRRQRFRETNSFVQNEKKDSHETIPTKLLGKNNEQVKSGVIDKIPSLCTSNANSEVSLEKMVQEYYTMQKDFSLDIKENTLSVPCLNPSFCKDKNHQSKVSSLYLDEKELSESKITPPQSALQSFRISGKPNNHTRLQMKTRSRNKSASANYSIDQSQEISRHQDDLMRQRIESASKPLKNNKHSKNSFSRQNILKFSVVPPKKNSTGLFIPLDTIASEQVVGQPNKKQIKSASVLQSVDEPSPKASSQIFIQRTVVESNVPLRTIHNIKINEATGPNYTLLAKPLQLPLTQLMQSTLKKIDERSSQPKMSKKKSLISEYEKSLLQNTFSEYFQEINPLGSRLKNEDAEVLNTMNQNFRAKRGLGLGKNTIKAARNPDEEKPYKLISELKQAYKDTQKADKILKDYRKDMPIKMGRQFLESSFSMALKHIKGQETVNGKIKMYDAWYIPPEDRAKRYNGVFDHSNYSRRYFKNYPKETISPESIRKIAKGEVKSYS